MLNKKFIWKGLTILAGIMIAGGLAYRELKARVDRQELIARYSKSMVIPFPARSRPVIDGTWARYSCTEDKIAGFDLAEGAAVIEAAKIIKTYGAGCTNKNDDTYGRLHKYYDSGTKTFFMLELENNCGKTGCLVNVKITNEKIADRSCAAKVKFKAQGTGKGIRLGDSRERVVAAYGAPYAERKVDGKPAVISMFYSDIAVSKDKTVPPEGVPPGHALEIELKNGKVIALELITGE